MAVLVSKPSCVLYEDDDLLVAHKPAGLNTHSPAPYAGEGIYEWLRHREPRWANLATIHRLDKGTSGVMVFAKTKVANKSLTEQFAMRGVQKRYVLLVSAKPSEDAFSVRCQLVRVGERYSAGAQGDFAETHFRYLGSAGPYHLLSAEPLTGRTHQIRAHIEMKGLPIVGDALYAGEPFPRLCLHSEELTFKHPASGKRMNFLTKVDFFASPALALRQLLINEDETNAYRVVHGGSDGAPYYVDRWANHLLVESARELNRSERSAIAEIQEALKSASVYHKVLNRQVARTSQQEAAPQPMIGPSAPASFGIRENGVQYEISFEQGYSVGLFLDQRENRRRFLVNRVAAEFPLLAGNTAGQEVLNTFAYTCGFSVCAALAGARTTSLDLSRKYLDWGQRNFRMNGLDPTQHDFIYGDVFEWAPRLAKKKRLFDVIILDPPTFSRSKTTTFQAERDYPALLRAVLPLLKPWGVLLACNNSHRISAEKFVEQVVQTTSKEGHAIRQKHYAPQPIDFPISKEETAHLKTIWLRLSRNPPR